MAGKLKGVLIKFPEKMITDIDKTSQGNRSEFVRQAVAEKLAKGRKPPPVPPPNPEIVFPKPKPIERIPAHIPDDPDPTRRATALNTIRRRMVTPLPKKK